MSLSIYQLKSRFQDFLRPLTTELYRRNITANQVTIFAMVISIIIGIGLCFAHSYPLLFLILPMWMFIRMALNAIDGMLAREFKQQSHFGAYLNELSDVIADAALFLPFAFLVGVNPYLIFSIIFIATLTEFSGVLGLMVGAERRYDGPMGKSDRAFVFGLIAFLWALNLIISDWINIALIIVLCLTIFTVINRIRCGLEQARKISN